MRTRATFALRTARRSIACSRGDGFARATSRRRASCSRTRIRATPMRWDGSRSTTAISPARARRCVPTWSHRPEALAALALLARTRADTAPVDRARVSRARARRHGRRRRGLREGRARSSATRHRCCSRPPRGCTRRTTASSRRSRSGARSSRSRAMRPRRPRPSSSGRARSGAMGRRRQAIDAPRAPHSHLPAERAPAAGAARAGAVAKRHRAAELRSVRRMLTFRMRLWSAARRRSCSCCSGRRASAARCSSRWTTRRAITSRRTASRTTRIKAGGTAEWLLNYRGGVVPAARHAGAPPPAPRSTASPSSRSTTAQLAQIRARDRERQHGAVPLEKAPKIAVYTPPDAPPWDDAVTLALKYAGIEYTPI